MFEGVTCLYSNKFVIRLFSKIGEIKWDCGG